MPGANPGPLAQTHVARDGITYPRDLRITILVIQKAILRGGFLYDQKEAIPWL
jgi:hypothetical protein